MKLVQTLALTLVKNFFFPESLGEIFSSPRKDYQLAYTEMQKEIRIEKQKQRD